MIRKALLIILIFITSTNQAQTSFLTPSDTLNKKRALGVFITEGVGATTSLLLLNEVWYKNYKSDHFHIFNDANEWLQMDKMGHATTSYYIGLTGINVLKWAGYSKKKASLLGGTLGLAYLTGVEILDGYSSGWGFSPSDMIANTSGTALVVGQSLLWDEQRIKMKFSFHSTNYPSYRPILLGSNFSQQLLKDYNGQTYWLSINIASFLNDQTKFPSWINIALGYGAEEMVSAEPNSDWCKENQSLCDQFNPYRQFYLSLDADLTKIKTKSKFIQTFTKTFGFIKIPAPTVIFQRSKVEFKGIYF